MNFAIILDLVMVVFSCAKDKWSHLDGFLYVAM